MASRAFEETFEATVPTGKVDPINQSDLWEPAYPHLYRSCSNKENVSALRTVVLENQYLRLAVCPDLGGRILHLKDKRTGYDVLPAYKELQCIPLGDHGASLMDGISFFGDERHSPNSLTKVDYVIHYPSDETEPAAVMTHNLLVGMGLSLQTCITLPPEHAHVLVELRVHNRTLLPIRHFAGCCVGFSGDYGQKVYREDCDVGIHFDGAVADEFGDVYCADFAVLAPREVSEYRMKIHPYSGTGGFMAKSADLVANVCEDELRIVSSSRFSDCKVYLLTRDGQTMETSADFEPAGVFRAKLPDGAVSVSVRRPDKTVLLSFEIKEASLAVDEPLTSTVTDSLHDSIVETDVNKAPSTFEEKLFIDVHRLHTSAPEIGHAQSMPNHLRGLANLVLASHQLADNDYREADARLNDALTHFSEDPLTWWLKAVVQRLLGQADEERPELLNAHYLSPMEPALRAESFLSLDQTMGSEPNPIMKPLVDDQDAMHEVVHLLVEAGLFAEAVRLMDEAQRHHEHPLLRYMFAWCLMRGTRMAAEASEQIKLASKAKIEPPFPWRTFEKRAVKELAQEFPEDKRLKILARIIEANPFYYPGAVNEQRPRY